MYWIVLFLSHARLIEDRAMRNTVFRMALFHLWDLNRQLGGEEAGPTMLQPLKVLVCMWGVMIHTEYQVFRTTWASSQHLVYDPHSCGCALCASPTGVVLPAPRYWEVLRQVGIPTCLCEVCLTRPQSSTYLPTAAAPPAAVPTAAAPPAAAPAAAAPSSRPSTSRLQARDPQALFRPPGMPEMIPVGHGRPLQPIRPRPRPAMIRPMVIAQPTYACERSADGLRVTLRRVKDEEELKED